MAIKALSQEPCDDAIDREYLFKVLDDFCGHDRTATITLDTLADLVYDMPPITQKSGKWIELPKALNPNENPCECSECGHVLSFMNCYPKSKYCPECGAKMRGAE